ncbi:MAG TPA: GNAT family N-acetyltransferase [Acidimicrobiales bacterium]|nr:GNAT family N-acetyltransferase [Acidimicrobiales bacterium]
MSGGASDRLGRFLTAWLGAWPGTDGAVTAVASDRRAAPAWDGRANPIVGVVTPTGGVVSVRPDLHPAAAAALAGTAPADVPAALSDAVGGRVGAGIFRWSDDPVAFEPVGRWVPFDDPVVPPWLRPFGGEVLVATDDGGRYLAGVGLKRHDPTGEEISVGTEEAARGKGLARRLVSQAARRVVDERHAAVTYLHAPDNLASARVAEACGFPDLGWKVIFGAPA